MAADGDRGRVLMTEVDGEVNVQDDEVEDELGDGGDIKQACFSEEILLLIFITVISSSLFSGIIIFILLCILIFLILKLCKVMKFNIPQVTLDFFSFVIWLKYTQNSSS